MNIVYLVFGTKIENYQQAYFSIFTALLHKNDDDKIIVITDDSSLFGFFEDKIETIVINQDTIRDWEGPHQFFWRVKIKALQLVAQKYPQDSILYLDSDTFFYKNTAVLRTALQSGNQFMHLNEGKLSQLSSKTEKLMWKQMKGKSYGNIIINENVAMWNAGLIGVSQKHFECLELTLQINDAMCADGVTRRLIEQFAFSLGLNQYSELQPADHIVGHYWGNKKQWNDTISLFLRECFMKKYHFDAVVERIKDMELSKIPIRIKESSTQRKLKNLIDKFYTNQRPVYVKK